MAEIKREPFVAFDEDGDELHTFDKNHTWADVIRWMLSDGNDAKDIIALAMIEENKDVGV